MVLLNIVCSCFVTQCTFVLLQYVFSNLSIFGVVTHIFLVNFVLGVVTPFTGA